MNGNIMTDAVQNFISNARGAEYGFLKAVAHSLECFGEKNNKPLYALMAFTNGKKFGGYKIEEGHSLVQFSAPLKRILKVALSDVKFTFKEGKAGVKVGKNGGLNNDVLEGVKVLAASKTRVKSEAFANAFPVIKNSIKKTAEQKNALLHAYMAKFAKDNSLSIGQVKAIASAA
mgnify:FL=1